MSFWSICCSTEMEKVAVLPVPDCACAMVSWSASMGMIPRCWMALGFSKPYAYMPRSRSSLRFMSSNDVTTSSQLDSMRIPSEVTSDLVSRGASLESPELLVEAAADEDLSAGGGEAEVGAAAGGGEAAERLETGFVLAIMEREVRKRT